MESNLDILRHYFWIPIAKAKCSIYPDSILTLSTPSSKCYSIYRFVSKVGGYLLKNVQISTDRVDNQNFVYAQKIVTCISPTVICTYLMMLLQYDWLRSFWAISQQISNRFRHDFGQITI
jgi:hypothetical protein